MFLKRLRQHLHEHIHLDMEEGFRSDRLQRPRYGAFARAADTVEKDDSGCSTHSMLFPVDDRQHITAAIFVTAG
jgi:hypothetical protein